MYYVGRDSALESNESCPGPERRGIMRSEHQYYDDGRILIHHLIHRLSVDGGGMRGIEIIDRRARSSYGLPDLIASDRPWDMTRLRRDVWSAHGSGVSITPDLCAKLTVSGTFEKMKSHVFILSVL
jgi:hypothetical protein